MYLFFDTETTGLPKSWKAPLTDLDNWPRLVQLAWIQYDELEKKITGRNQIIKPQGFSIPYEAERVHGISTQKALEEGIPLKQALEEFAEAISNSKFLIAHNISFDEKIIGAEFLREKLPIQSSPITKICTMKSSSNFCKIPNKNGYKWPNLAELHQKLFNTGFNDAHDASADVAACADCFFELKKLGVI